MSKFGLCLTINKYHNYFDTVSYYEVFDSAEILYKSLIDILSSHFTHLNIDFPQEINDFEYLWFGQQYVRASVFTYRVFNMNKWSEPWEAQDIYDDVLENLLNHDSAHPPDFNQIYGEPDPDENVVDKFNISDETNEQIRIMDAKLNQIMSDSQHITPSETLVSECKCKHCVESDNERKIQKALELEHSEICKKIDEGDIEITPMEEVD